MKELPYTQHNIEKVIYTCLHRRKPTFCKHKVNCVQMTNWTIFTAVAANDPWNANLVCNVDGIQTTIRQLSNGTQRLSQGRAEQLPLYRILTSLLSPSTGRFSVWHNDRNMQIKIWGVYSLQSHTLHLIYKLSLKND